MEIYVVKQGDDIVSIANQYGITVEKLISDNGLINPYSLVIGQTIVILYPKETHTVMQGDTLESIAESNGITLMQLMRNNPFLYNREFIYTDESLVTRYNTVKDIQVNGFTYVFINKEILIRALPYLTFLSIFNYRIADNISIIDYGDDTDIINLAKEYSTTPLMMISVFSQTGNINIEFVYELLLDTTKQDKIINDILRILKSKEFMGVNLLISKLTYYNQSLYLNYIIKLSKVLRSENYLLMITVSPDYSAINDKIDYRSFQFYVDRIIFLQNIWGMNKQPPAPISDISKIKPYIEHVTSFVPSEYISLGKPLNGFDWELPFVPDLTVAKLMSLNSAIALAYDLNAEIQLDEMSQTPYFNYIRSELGAPENHIVWFIDARSIRALDEIIIEYDLVGTGLWHLTSYNQQLYSMTNAIYNIIKFPAS